MSDMRPTIVARSDQLNSDDLLGGPITIKITAVNVRMDEQPVTISYEGDNGKPWKPGKSMRRVLVNVWGHDSNNYIGRSLTLYRDEKVQFGGLAVGGIRISNMSDIPREMTMALTASRGNKKPFVVRPLVIEREPPKQPTRTWGTFLDELEPRLAAAPDREAVDAILFEDLVSKALVTLKNGALARLQTMIEDAKERTSPVEDEAGETTAISTGDDQ